jgi:hypothetical protein
MMNWKGCGRKRSWPIFRYYPEMFLEERKETRDISNQASRSTGRNLNPRPREYEAGVLTN